MLYMAITGPMNSMVTREMINSLEARTMIQFSAVPETILFMVTEEMTHWSEAMVRIHS